MKKHLLALDQGTTSSRALLFDTEGKILGTEQREFPQYYLHDGWVEHDPAELWTSQFSVTKALLDRQGLHASDIACIGITNQRETIILWDRKTGEAISNAIVWQDRRTAAYTDSLKETHSEIIRERTGLLPDPYFSGSKLKWLLDNIPGARARAERGELAAGTVDSWLVWKCTQGAVHATDASNASRTLLMNIHTLQWDDALLALFDIPKSLLPEIRPSSHVYGECTIERLKGIPIAGIAGDQHAALFGQCCFEPGMAKSTYGTGSFVLMNTGDEPIKSKNNMLTTVAWQIGDKATYALEGSIFMSGAIVQWLRDEMRFFRTSPMVEELAKSVSSTGGVYFVPAFTGLGAPHWDPYARGMIIGLTRDTTDAHIARAALEAIAFQTADVLEGMQKDTGIDLIELRVDGGAAKNKLLMQMQSDVLGKHTLRPNKTEITAFGAATLAGLATGIFKDLDHVSQLWELECCFDISDAARDLEKRYHTQWKEAVKRSLNWSNL